MAEKTTQVVLEALGRAMTDPAGVPLHGSKTAPGLFAATAPGKQAAQACKDDGYLQVLRTESRGKTVLEICTLTEKGLAYLLSQVSPRETLEHFVRTLDERQTQVGALVAAAQQTQATFDALKSTAEKVLHQLGKPGSSTVAVSGTNGSAAWKPALLSFLGQWDASRSSEDCPLPELYRQAQKLAPNLTIGHFQDGLRQLHDQEQIYLHPWTGPLYDLPEPPYALLIGHEVAYYASLRKS